MHHDDFYETVKEEEATSMTKSWHRLEEFTHVREIKNYLILRGSMPSECIKEIDKEEQLPTSTEDMMDQESLQKKSMEGD